MRPSSLLRSTFAAALLFAIGCGSLHAQGSPNDGIDRNLLQRQQQSRDFHVRLYDNARAAQDSVRPLPPVPNSFIGPELYQPLPAQPSADRTSAGTATDAATRQQLNDSQLRRQLELQTQNKFLDEPTRQQQSQIQQLQFGRENQAQQLQQQIQRESGDSMQRLH